MIVKAPASESGRYKSTAQLKRFDFAPFSARLKDVSLHNTLVVAALRLAAGRLRHLDGIQRYKIVHNG
jgi:hypothetical protein